MATRDTRGIGTYRSGDLELDRFLEQMRDRILAVQRVQAESTGTTTTDGGGGTPTTGPPGPPGPPGGDPTPDLTPPPTPSGVVVSAGLDFVFITTDAPTFSQGHGYDRTIVYGAQYGGTGPLPTFGDAVVVHEFRGQVGSFAAEPGKQWHIWLKWRSNDAVLSISPDGGANGRMATTSLIGNANLGPLIIEAGQLADGAVTTAKFAAGIQPVSIVAALPNPVGYTGPLTVLLTTDGKLYRYVAGAWVTAVAAVDITGTITGTQIADDSISTPKLQANSVTAAQIAANTITANEIAANAITASELAANSVVAGKIAAAAISATEISAAAIQAVHLAANSIAVGTAAIQNGAIVNAMIGDATITSAKIVSLAASKIIAGSIAVGEYIQSSDYVNGVSGWRWGGNTGEVGSAMIRGLLTAAQIDSRGLTIKDALGNIVLSSGTPVNRGGGYVNTDPLVQAPWEWTFSSVTGAAPVRYQNFAPSFGLTSGFAGLLTAWDKSDGGYAEIYSDKFPVSNFKTYLIESSLYLHTSNATIHYLGVAFYDGNGNLLDGTTYPMTGWLAAGTFHYWGLAGSSSPVGATRYSFSFGANGTGKIPPAATHAKVLVLGNYTNSGGIHRWSWGGAQVRELQESYPSSVNPITGSNVSTFIASAAITDAQIANLSASKIVTGTLTGQTLTGGVIQTAASGKRIELSESTNEARFFGNRGDGTIEQLASLGIKASGSDFVIGAFGAIAAGHSRVAVEGLSNSSTGIRGGSVSAGGVYGFSTSAIGVEGNSAADRGVVGSTSSTSSADAGVVGIALAAGAHGVMGSVQAGTGSAVVGYNNGSGTGYGGEFHGNSTRAPLWISTYTTAPSVSGLGALAVIRNPTTLNYSLCYGTSSGWKTVGTNLAWNDPGDPGGGA